MYVYNLYQSRGGGVRALKIYEEKYRITKVSMSRDRSTYGRLLSIHTPHKCPLPGNRVEKIKLLIWFYHVKTYYLPTNYIILYTHLYINKYYMCVAARPYYIVL